MIKFKRHSDCQLCPLYGSAKNPGLPSRPLFDGQVVHGERAILFVGQSPGYWEDKGRKDCLQGKIFIAYTGGLVEKMVEESGLTDSDRGCDVYLANACRCKPPQGGNEAQAYIRACRGYLDQEILELQKIYKEVIIFALGAKACYSTLNISSLTESLKKQGKRSILGEPGNQPRVFCTYHPAKLHPSRQPGLVHAVQNHFSLFMRYLRGEFNPDGIKIVPEVGIPVPKVPPAEVSIDIETYGILAGKEQTVFHPIKSKVVDGIPFEEQIVTISFGWEEDGRERTALYIWGNKAHRRTIRLWFRRLSKDKIVCTGQNFKFDLLYLYFSQDPEIPYWIDPRRLLVDDTLLWSFLLYEQQPEKGLKEISTLFGTYDYSQHKVMSKSGNAKSPRDKNLHLLNCADTAATLRLKKELKRRIKERYGAETAKLSDTCSWVRNMIVWVTFDLEANGSAFNIPKLQKFHDKTEARCKKLMNSAEVVCGIKLAGSGSDAPLRQMVLDCVVEAGLVADPRVEYSPKTKKISIGVENVNLIKQHIPRGRNFKIITAFQKYKEHSKITSTYTGPLLNSPRKGIVLYNGSVGLVFPSWYPVPAYAERGGGSDDKAGGQIQGRLSCRKPARQTEPKSVRRCSTSRFYGGKLVEYDVAQDHLRMAALLSGDPPLMGAYEVEGESIHLQTASTIFPDKFCPNFKKKHERLYTVAKNLNFLVLFRGGASAFQHEAREKAGVELDINFCQGAIEKWHRKHYIYKQWQDEMIALASRQGYLTLPTGWSRTFGLGKENLAGQAAEVCNFLHQAPCAQITQSAHYRAKRKFLRYRLRSLLCLNIYDAIFADIYPREESAVDEIVGEAMSHPPLLRVFEDWVSRTIPWCWEKKEYK